MRMKSPLPPKYMAVTLHRLLAATESLSLLQSFVPHLSVDFEEVLLHVIVDSS